MAVEVHPFTEQLALPHLPRTPSLTSSDDTSGSSDSDLPFKRRLPSFPHDRKQAVRFSLAELSKTQRLSSLLRSHSHLSQSLATAIKQPPVLANLLDYLPWAYFYTLTCTCREFRHILRNPDLKDVVLARYVPGYKLCIGSRDMQRFQAVPTTITHLDLLCES